jgi:ankyrin repeat protein
MLGAWRSSPFLEACRDGNLEMVIKLTQEGEDLNQMEFPSQKTPLHLACMNDYPEIVSFLISKGAQVNLFDYVRISLLNILIRISNKILLCTKHVFSPVK